MGDYGDNDVTAITVQALAPYYKTNSKVKTAVDKALILLSNRQKADGDYASYGINNPESTAQVLVALSSLGINCENDGRFIKNGNTLIDGIEKYRLADGSFCHQIGKGSNSNATVQVFYAMVSYIRLNRGETPLYIFDNSKPVKIEKQAVSTPESSRAESMGTPSASNSSSSTAESVTENAEKLTESTTISTKTAGTEISSRIETTSSTVIARADSENTDSTVSDSDIKNTPKTPNYKLWAILIVVGLGGVACIVLLILKKKN